MYDQETIAQLNGPELRPPMFLPEWRLKFELDLHWPLIEECLALDLIGRFAEHERSRFFHHLINRASAYCHFWEDDFINKAQRKNVTF